ncbi:heparinase II/III family protein [Lichenibacterium dinghuense]|uniref:heparinase II/III family protein n=1 Tax=Lichenibacterium dinghuense TaxID=2895977 RepID=UPI001F01F9BA|nr:heparinase II/III family protein [Lichenibacterium sp. 6Y81]
MKDETVADQARLAVLVLQRGLRGLDRAMRRPVRVLAARRCRVPERLVIAPQDIRTADPTVAEDIYSGYFVFDGKAVNTRGASPFEVEPPSEAWAAALAGFGWLRHLRAADTALARVNARALVGDWIVGRGGGAAPNWPPEVVARRLLSWLSQAPLILEGADGVFYRLFTRSLARQADALLAAIDRGLAGLPRLTAAVALCQLSLCAEGLGRLQRRASRLLVGELGRQILPDGGHASRNPQALLDLLLDLLPLRQSYAARGLPPPTPLLDAIDRMIAMVRRLRHGDGALALFNGMGTTRPDVVATVLAYEEARGARPAEIGPSGYLRLAAGSATVIIDAGPPPAPAYAAAAHAGTLALEFSHGAQRIVVNCGAPTVAQPAAREASRATAAHSTLVLDGRSSSLFARLGPLRGLLYAGPRRVSVERDAGPDGPVTLSHDGYARPAGHLHLRRLSLSPDGLRLSGEDRLEPAPGARPRRLGFALRFHLHPALRSVPARRGSAVLIACPDGGRWLFEAGGLPLAIEESISFAQAEGPRRTEQVVLHGHVPDLSAVAWSLSRVDGDLTDS